MKKLLFAAVVSLFTTASAMAATTDETGSHAQAVNDAAATSINVIEQNYAASKPAPAMPGMVTGPVFSPSLFSMVGRPANITGLPLWSQMLFIPDYHVTAKGDSNGTAIVYNGIQTDEEPGDGMQGITLNLSGVARGEIAGSITIESLKNQGRSIDFPTLLHDAAVFIKTRKELRNRKVTLLTVPEAMSFTLAVDSKSSGMSLGSALSRFFDGATGILGGIVGGASTSGGVTAPTGTVGCTFLLIVDSGHNRKIDITGSYRDYVARINGQSSPRTAGPEEREVPSTKKEQQAESIKQ
jgi:hypothetical protein